SRLLAAPRPDGSNSSGSWRRFWRGRTEIRRVTLRLVSHQRRIHELEYVYSANPPLAVDRLYGDRHRQLRRHGIGGASGPGRLLATAAAVLAPVHGSIHVRAAVCRKVARR